MAEVSILEKLTQEAAAKDLRDYLKFLESCSSELDQESVPARVPDASDATREGQLETPHIDRVLLTRSDCSYANRLEAVESKLNTLMKERTSRGEEKNKEKEGRRKSKRTSKLPLKNVRSPASDEKLRRDLSNTVQQLQSQNQLIKDLDDERERRWKAEQAAGRLLHQVQLSQEKESSLNKRLERSLERVTELERQLTNTASVKETVSSENEALKKEVSQLRQALKSSREQSEALGSQLSSHQLTLEKSEKESSHKMSQHVKSLKEKDKTIYQLENQIDLLRKSAKALKGQVLQLQSLLVQKEHQRISEANDRVSLNGSEFKEAVAKRVQEETDKANSSLQQVMERLSLKEQDYASLENEFRVALQVEAGRYQQLFDSHEALKEEVEASRNTAVNAIEKEKKAEVAVNKMATLAKEQKRRIVELNKTREVLSQQHESKCAEFEREMGMLHTVQAKLQLLEEENGRLQSEVTAQRAVVEGLREERSLWGRELAHQGASLAQDRGSMESKINDLTAKVTKLGDQVKKLEDEVSVKQKMIEDQNETIQELRKEKVKGQEEAQRAKELQALNDDLDSQVQQLSMENTALQGEVERLHGQKDKLKTALTGLQSELDETANRYRALKLEWKGRVDLIESLEENMKSVQKSLLQKEELHSTEMSELHGQIRTLQGQLQRAEERQTEMELRKESEFQKLLQTKLNEKDVQLKASEDKVAAVESEMRDLLVEVEQQKKSVRWKMNKLSSVLQEVQLPLH